MNVDAGFQLSDFAGIARRRGKIAVFVALGVALVAYWVAMALPNEFTSYATVLVEPQAVDEELVRAGVQSSDLNERLHLMTAQILSRPRLSRIIEQFDLYRDESEYLLRENIIDLMRERIRVEPVVPDLERGRGGRRDLEINEFRIFFTDYSPQQAANVAQRLANDFIETHISARVQVSQKSLEFIQDELERLAERIRAVEADVAKVKNEHPGQLPEDMSANQRRLERVLADAAVAQRALAESTSDESFFRSQIAQASAFGAPNDDASPVRKLELLRLKLAELKSRGFTDKHPDVIATMAEIEGVEEAVERLGDEDGGGSTSVLAQQTEAQARRAALRRQSAEQEIFRLQGLADEIQDLLAKTPAVAEMLDGLNREYEHLFASFQDFSNRHLEATVQAQLERRQLGEQFRVLEAAFPSPDPSAPNRLLIIALGIVLGIGFGAGVAVLLETIDTSPHSARRLQTELQLPVLASIPQIWLEADRIALRRRRLRSFAATSAVVLFGLTGGFANYLWVNGITSSNQVILECN